MVLHIRTGAGAWVRCSSGSTGRSLASGVLSTTKVRCRKFLRRNGGIAGRHLIRNVGAGSTTGLKTHISRFDDREQRWPGSGTSRPCKIWLNNSETFNQNQLPCQKGAKWRHESEVARNFKDWFISD